jgi:nitric oxide reductase activation protein
MKPKGLKRLRQWVEGDEFDYRALVDHVVDRWVGQMPTDRLYIKKIKHRRDVAALLLVDLSRSTANRVSGTTTSVLDIEKVAIVLFAEALAVVGDEFAIAGFSGTGRLGVDYFHIKDFSDTMSKTVKQRINAMAPQRNTRMGAAIRHAAEQFKDVDSKVRLLILLGDGFPNDTEYKQTYAVSDTSKSIAELRTADIHVHAITVNIEIKASAQLDRLFGQVHHTCITDIAELPDKLVRIYGSLTRY